jgi:leucyl aminopeptidase
MPLVAEYRDDIKSPVADLKNIGGGHAGSITAALFLEAFVGETPWVHLDIAGPAYTEKALPYMPLGGTGFGVRTLVRYVTELALEAREERAASTTVGPNRRRATAHTRTRARRAAHKRK